MAKSSKRRARRTTRVKPPRKAHAIRKRRRPFVHIGDMVGAMIVMLCRLNGASIENLCEATGWQANSVRSAISNPIKKRLRLTVTSEKVAGVRVYRVIV